jgi:DNA-binding SARP family transcriptional activator
VDGGELTEILGLPGDRRGLVLAFGAALLVALGTAQLLGGNIDGSGYLAGGIALYLFLHRRLLPSVVGVAVGLAGLATLIAGNPVALGQVAVGIILTAISLRRPAPLSTGMAGRKSQPPVGVGPAEFAAPASVRSGVPVPVAESEATPLGSLSSAIDNQSSPAKTAAAPTLEVQTLGRFRILAGGQDVTATLLAKRTLIFPWTYLLARAIAGLRPLHRDELASEIAPGLPDKTRKVRLRKLLWDLKHDLPQALTTVLADVDSHLSIDVEGLQIDAIEMRALAARVGVGGQLISDELAGEVAGFLDGLSAGEFLPRFEDFEAAVSNRRGVAGTEVEALRREVVRWHGDLVCALADRRLADGDSIAAVRILEPAFEEDPAREDLARRLVNAYTLSGQPARASALRRSLDLVQEV